MKRINKEKRKPMSIKWRIFASLIFFVAVVILVLWLLQVFFLERFYMHIKSSAVKEAANQITSILNEQDYATSLQSIAKENDFCVGVYENKDTDIGSLQQIYPNGNDKENVKCRISNLEQNARVIATLQQEVKENGGSASKLIEEDNQFTLPVPPLSDVFNKGLSPAIMQNKLKNMEHRIYRNLTYISVMEGSEKGSLKTLIIDAQLTPVNATVDTIKAQFLIIAGILILVACGVAFYLSRKVARPIINISNSAKVLAKGEYRVEFNGRDYLEVKELSDTLNYAAKELSKVEELRKELIANMSHDLRTPLTMIAGYGEVMRDIPGENTPDNVQIIIDETTRLTTLVNDMLDLSKLQAGVMELHAGSFNITQEIENIMKRYDKLLTAQNIHLHFEHSEEVFVVGDVVKLGQVIYNLTNNAINYCGEDRKVTIKQIIHGHKVCFQFIDHGEGIDEEQLPYIWERYYKANSNHVRAKIGSGLGLSIVKVVLELHQAEYGVKSKKHHGSIFWFILPLDTNK